MMLYLAILGSEFKPVKLRIKIDLVSYPARVEGLVIMGREESPWDNG